MQLRLQDIEVCLVGNCWKNWLDARHPSCTVEAAIDEMKLLILGMGWTANWEFLRLQGSVRIEPGGGQAASFS